MSPSSAKGKAKSKGKGKDKGKDKGVPKEPSPATSQQPSTQPGASSSVGPPEPQPMSRPTSTKEKDKGKGVRKDSPPRTSQEPSRQPGASSSDAPEDPMADLPEYVRKALYEAEALSLQAKQDRERVAASVAASASTSTSKTSPERSRNEPEPFPFQYFDIPASDLLRGSASTNTTTSAAALLSASLSTGTTTSASAPKNPSNHPQDIPGLNPNSRAQRMLGMQEHEENTVFVILDQYKRLQHDYGRLGVSGEIQKSIIAPRIQQLERWRREDLERLSVARRVALEDIARQHQAVKDYISSIDNPNSREGKILTKRARESLKNLLQRKTQLEKGENVNVLQTKSHISDIYKGKLGSC